MIFPFVSVCETSPCILMYIRILLEYCWHNDGQFVLVWGFLLQKQKKLMEGLIFFPRYNTTVKPIDNSTKYVNLNI